MYQFANAMRFQRLSFQKQPVSNPGRINLFQGFFINHPGFDIFRLVPDSLVSEFATRAGRKVYDEAASCPTSAPNPNT